MAQVRALTGVATKAGAIPVGAVLDASDPLVVACPQFFAPIEAVEQATAAPGEKRAASHPAKKAPVKKAAPRGRA